MVCEKQNTPLLIPNELRRKGFGSLQVWSVQVCANIITQSSQKIHPMVRPCTRATSQTLQASVVMLNVKVHNSTKDCPFAQTRPKC